MRGGGGPLPGKPGGDFKSDGRGVPLGGGPFGMSMGRILSGAGRCIVCIKFRGGGAIGGGFNAAVGGALGGGPGGFLISPTPLID